MRRLLTYLALVALLVVALPSPVTAQTASPTIAINPDYGRAGTSGTWTIQVSGSGFRPGRPANEGGIAFAGVFVANFATDGNGNIIPVTIEPNRRPVGPYTVAVSQQGCPPTRVCSPLTASTTFWSMDATATDDATGRDCAPAGTPWVLRVEGRGWEPDQRAYVEFRRDATTVAEAIRILVQKDGTFVVRINVPAQPSGPSYSIYLYDLREREITLPWTIPCPLRPTTSTTSTTINPADTTTTTTVVVPGEVSLVVEPSLGPPGFVAQVRGFGYPPGPVVVRWEGGVGQVTVTAGDDGAFSTPLLVFPNDRLGARAVVATAGPVERFAPFLVVPGTVKPSGRDVTQITRIRRHLQR